MGRAIVFRTSPAWNLCWIAAPIDFYVHKIGRIHYGSIDWLCVGCFDNRFALLQETSK